MSQRSLPLSLGVAAAPPLGRTALLARLRPLTGLITNYFSEETHPLNLAIVRVLVFIDCLWQINWDQTIWFSELPRQLLFPPNSLTPFVKYLPINPELATITAALFVGASILGLVGLFTRWATLVALLSGLYVLLIPQLWGKVDQNNHVLWFLAILLFSRCSDALSIDAIRRAWTARDGDAVIHQRPSVAYALPLRIMWLLLGIIYLFPGVWKARSAGLEWGTREIFNIFHQKWFELGWWVPVIRIDQWPTLVTLIALGTIVWELSFSFLIFFKRTRPLAAITGILFHVNAYVFLRILIWDLSMMYASFFDMAALGRRLGSRLFPTPLHVVYDERCRVCRGSVGTLHVLDVFGGLRFERTSATSPRTRPGVDDPDAQLRSAHLQARLGSQVYSGFAAYTAAARRVPLLWVWLGLGLVRPIAKLVEAVHDRLHHAVPLDVPVGSPRSEPRPFARSLRPLAAMGAILIVANSIFGWHGTTSWPFTVYPTFMCCFPPTATVIAMDFIAADGRPVTSLKVGQADPNLPIGSERLSVMVTRILLLPDDGSQQTALRALIGVEKQSSPEIAQASEVRVYREEYDVNPDRRGDPPVHEDFIMTLPLTDAS